MGGEARPHSSDYFGDERDFWWNDDYLDLLARRLALAAVGRAVDVGCGVGHWGQRLYPRLATDALLIGVERDAGNLPGAVARARCLRPAGRAAFIRGDAQALPLADASVDLATCQTLLMHLADPLHAIREMARVTRPGGLVLAVEPNNMWNWFGISSLTPATPATPADEAVRAAELTIRQSFGRMARGLGCDFTGELLPGLFREAGLEPAGVWLNDKVAPLLPPYGDPAGRALLAAADNWRKTGRGPHDRAALLADIEAGGGAPDLLDSPWGFSDRQEAARTQAVEAGRYHAAGGSLMYIVAGRVPA